MSTRIHPEFDDRLIAFDLQLEELRLALDEGLLDEGVFSKIGDLAKGAARGVGRIVGATQRAGQAVAAAPGKAKAALAAEFAAGKAKPQEPQEPAAPAAPARNWPQEPPQAAKIGKKIGAAGVKANAAEAKLTSVQSKIGELEGRLAKEPKNKSLRPAIAALKVQLEKAQAEHALHSRKVTKHQKKYSLANAGVDLDDPEQVAAAKAAAREQRAAVGEKNAAIRAKKERNEQIRAAKAARAAEAIKKERERIASRGAAPVPIGRGRPRPAAAADDEEDDLPEPTMVPKSAAPDEDDEARMDREMAARKERLRKEARAKLAAAGRTKAESQTFSRLMRRLHELRDAN